MASRARGRGGSFGEKDFYLEEFRGRTVLVVIDATVAASRVRLDDLVATVDELVRNQTRVVLWWPVTAGASLERLERAFAAARPARLARPRRAELPVVPVRAPLPGTTEAEALRAAAWLRLRRGSLCILAADGDSAAALVVAGALAVWKAVVVHRDGGLATSGGAVSFVDQGVLETILREGEAEWAGLGNRREILEAIRAALRAGVGAVNLCAAGGIGRELFTYVGSGTLFTPDDYVRVESLTLDLYAQAERLLLRGEREGMLKPRTIAETATLLASGYGALVGGRHLAGVASLVTAPYEGSGAGELAALYTITRFKGEGLGRRLIEHVVAAARARGLACVFACTTNRRAQRFFEDQRFVRVGRDEVPAAKWSGYEATRLRRVACFRRAC